MMPLVLRTFSRGQFIAAIARLSKGHVDRLQGALLGASFAHSARLAHTCESGASSYANGSHWLCVQVKGGLRQHVMPHADV